MNSAHIHLALNHFPVIGIIFAIMMLGYALLRKNDEVVKVGLVILVVAGLVSIPVFLTGEPAEEFVEGLPGVYESIIEQHENYAKYALVTTLVTSAAALFSLIYALFDQRKATWLVVGTFFLALISGGWMLKTASIGGQIRHTEIRNSTFVTQPEQKNATEMKHEKDDDDH